MVFEKLNPLLHNQLRLAIISLLTKLKEAEFTKIKEITNATAGNLSVQIHKLKGADYIIIQKNFKENYPVTSCKITKKGIEAYEQYCKALKGYLAENQKHEPLL